MNHELDVQEYEREIQAEVIEMEAETEQEYQRKVAEYSRQLEKWKLWKRKQVSEMMLVTNNMCKVYIITLWSGEKKNNLSIYTVKNM